MASKLWNFIQFQIGWFALVLFAAQGKSEFGMLLVAVLIAAHLRWFNRPGEWLLLLLLGSLGWLWESLFYVAGFIEYPGHAENTLFAPLWMAVFWVNFAAVLNHSLDWLKPHYFAAAVLGAFGGPLAFLGGEALGAAFLPDKLLACLVLGIAWAILMPATMLLANRLNLRFTNITANRVNGAA